LRIVDSAGAAVPPGEVGEMLLRGPNVSPGYWSGSDRLTGVEDGWCRTGDLVRQDEDGAIWFVSRLNDLIVSGGANVSPVEVEQVLLLHPAVADAAVVGAPDTIMGERVVAFIELAEGADLDSLDMIARFASERLADFKLPGRLLVMAGIPRNALGKVDRKALRSVLEHVPAGGLKPTNPAAHAADV
jgi:acyl-CoA synthetase (AMP-forming)/AMP-acid ligase II